MNKKEYNKIEKECQDLLDDFGFADKDVAVSQLKSIFNVEFKDVNIAGTLKGKTIYEVHYKDYIIELEINHYEFKIKNIFEYDDTI